MPTSPPFPSFYLTRSGFCDSYLFNLFRVLLYTGNHYYCPWCPTETTCNCLGLMVSKLPAGAGSSYCALTARAISSRATMAIRTSSRFSGCWTGQDQSSVSLFLSCYLTRVFWGATWRSFRILCFSFLKTPRPYDMWFRIYMPDLFDTYSPLLST